MRDACTLSAALTADEAMDSSLDMTGAGRGPGLFRLSLLPFPLGDLPAQSKESLHNEQSTSWQLDVAAVLIGCYCLRSMVHEDCLSETEEAYTINVDKAAPGGRALHTVTAGVPIR